MNSARNYPKRTNCGDDFKRKDVVETIRMRPNKLLDHRLCQGPNETWYSITWPYGRGNRLIIVGYVQEIVFLSRLLQLALMNSK